MASRHGSNLKHKIQKVPSILRSRENFSMVFEPRFVSFGPIHHEKKPKEEIHHEKAIHHEEEPRKYKEGEHVKENLKLQFISDHRNTKDMYCKILKDIKKLRECYSTELVDCYSDTELAEIFLEDGCAILQFISSRLEKKIPMKRHQAVFVENDMFLLENQLPFQVLELLFASSDQETQKNWRKDIIEFIYQISPLGNRKSDLYDCKWDELNHLLELYREKLFDLDKQENQVEDCFCIPVKDNALVSYHCTTDLKESGVNLKPNENSRFLNDIRFTHNSIWGTLKIPHIKIDDTVEPLFTNMIAYELCPDSPDNYTVSSYVWFLSSIIDNPKDVKQLRNAHVFRNMLGNDEEVVQVFNRINTDLVAETYRYGPITKSIQRHYEHLCWPMLAMFYNTYFTPPWTAIAFIAGILVFVFTVLQFYYDYLPRDQGWIQKI